MEWISLGILAALTRAAYINRRDIYIRKVYVTLTFITFLFIMLLSALPWR